MFEKIDVRSIIAEHFRTYVRNDTKRTNFFDYALFLGIPNALAIALASRSVVMNAEVAGLLMTSISILAGLLFNLLVLLQTLSVSAASPVGKRTKQRILCELHANVSYAILVAGLDLPVLILARLEIKTLSVAISSAAAFLTLHFGLSLLMILKRIYVALSRELTIPGDRPELGEPGNSADQTNKTLR